MVIYFPHKDYEQISQLSRQYKRFSILTSAIKNDLRLTRVLNIFHSKEDFHWPFHKELACKFSVYSHATFHIPNSIFFSQVLGIKSGRFITLNRSFGLNVYIHCAA
jgi:hypothetical protein